MSAQAPAHWDEQNLRLHREARVVLGYANPARRFWREEMDYSFFDPWFTVARQHGLLEWLEELQSQRN